MSKTEAAKQRAALRGPRFANKGRGAGELLRKFFSPKECLRKDMADAEAMERLHFANIKK